MANIVTSRPKTKGFIFIFLTIVLLIAGGLFDADGSFAPITTGEAQVHKYLSPYDSDAVISALQDRLYYGILERQSVIDISDNPIPITEFGKIWTDLRYDNADLYMIESRYTYNYKTIDGIRYVTKVHPHYTMTAEEMSAAQLKWADKIQTILSGRNPNWNTMQTALYLHDYLVLNTYYDLGYTNYDAYSMLTTGTGVCMAYTLAYTTLLESLGIPCDYTVSKEMNHAWNKVNIGGRLFNVDVTWDDPTPDRLGYVPHKHFLISDSVMDDNHSYTWDEGYGMCSDTFYDDAFWKDVNTAIIPVGDEFYFIYKGSIYCWTADNKLEKRVSLSSKWYTDSKKNRYWRYTNSDGSYSNNYSVMWPAGDKIMYNAAYSIKTFDPETNKLATLYSYNGKGCIYGFTYNGSSLTLQVGSQPNGPFELVTVTDFKQP